MDGPVYTAYHPRWLRPPVSTYWWLRRRSYLVFILRELSSLFIAWIVAYLLILVRAIGQGPAAWRESSLVGAPARAGAQCRQPRSLRCSMLSRGSTWRLRRWWCT